MLPTKDNIVLRVSNVVHFDGCRRKWYLEQNYTSGKFTPAFFIGTGIHKGLEWYHRALHAGSSDPALVARSRVIAWGQQQEKEWNFVQTWWEIDGDRLIDEIIQYIEHYASFNRENALQGTILEDEEGLIIERRFTYPILDEHGEPILDSKGNAVFLTGQCDLAVERSSQVFIIDHKSFSTYTMAQRPDEGLEVDDQGTAYTYLFWRAYGELPKAFIYNVFIKRLPQAPAVLKNGQLSVSKDQPTTAALYRQTVKAMGLAMEPYRNIIAHFEQQGYSNYFQRWQSSRNIHEIKAFERRLAIKARDIVRLVEDPERYAYASGSSYRCGGCPFIAPCKAMDDGGDAQIILDSQFERKELWSIEE